ncbi:MAG: glycosyltransferase, partial [Cyanobacteria bacterium]|nr:glycosyltransferase [Cyanobacteriota bacterium]
MGALETEKSSEIPHIYVVIAGRNEAKTLEDALIHLLNQDYPNLTLLFVNDRSEDDTLQVVQRIQEVFTSQGKESPDSLIKPLNPPLPHPPKLECITIETLPEGWLGKTHALFYGTQALIKEHLPAPQTNDYFLFTDADIVLEPTALRRVIGYAQSVVAPARL